MCVCTLNCHVFRMLINLLNNCYVLRYAYSTAWMYSNSFIPSVQHKTKCLVCTAKGINPLSGELQLASDLDFYIDGVRIQQYYNILPWIYLHIVSFKYFPSLDGYVLIVHGCSLVICQPKCYLLKVLCYAVMCLWYSHFVTIQQEISRSINFQKHWLSEQRSSELSLYLSRFENIIFKNH